MRLNTTNKAASPNQIILGSWSNNHGIPRVNTGAGAHRLIRPVVVQGGNGGILFSFASVKFEIRLDCSSVLRRANSCAGSACYALPGCSARAANVVRRRSSSVLDKFVAMISKVILAP